MGTYAQSVTRANTESRPASRNDRPSVSTRTPPASGRTATSSGPVASSRVSPRPEAHDAETAVGPACILRRDDHRVTVPACQARRVVPVDAEGLPVRRHRIRPRPLGQRAAASRRRILQQREDLVGGGHGVGAQQARGHDRAGGVGELDGLARGPPGQQAVDEGAAERVAGTEPAHHVDRPGGDGDGLVGRRHQHPVAAQLDDRQLDAPLEQAAGGLVGVRRTDRHVALDAVAHGDRGRRRPRRR